MALIKIGSIAVDPEMIISVQDEGYSAEGKPKTETGYIHLRQGGPIQVRDPANREALSKFVASLPSAMPRYEVPVVGRDTLSSGDGAVRETASVQ